MKYNIYETTLTRRSIRKHTNGVQQKDQAGDVSLGLTIKILNGKAVIRHVKTELIDGSETPACQTIQRGDVIRSLNGTSLVLPKRDLEACHNELMERLKPINTPNEDVVLQMMKSAFVRVTVDFQGKDAPKNYIVNIEPEGGNVVGSWGAAGWCLSSIKQGIDEKVDGQYQ